MLNWTYVRLRFALRKSYPLCFASAILMWTGAFAATPTAMAQMTQGVVISEFLADNDNGLLDADGDSSDWIELHNASDAAVNLDGWYLTDDPDLNDL